MQPRTSTRRIPPRIGHHDDYGVALITVTAIVLACRYRRRCPRHDDAKQLGGRGAPTASDTRADRAE
jgi:hypothetical protein